jgi:hypothetical protein
MPASKTHVDSGTLQLREAQTPNEQSGCFVGFWLRHDQGMSDDDRYAAKAAIAGPLAPGFTQPRFRNRDLKCAG